MDRTCLSNTSDAPTAQIQTRPPSSIALVQLWCSCAYCWGFWRCTGVSMGTLNGLWHNKLMLCVSDTFQNQHQFEQQVICWVGPHVHQWTVTLFTTVLFLDHFWYWPLQTGNTHNSSGLEMLWPSRLAITVWPLSNSNPYAAHFSCF